MSKTSRLIGSAILLLLAAARPVHAQPDAITRALNEARWTDAVRLLDSAVVRSPRDARLFQQRGRAWRELTEYDKAIADYTKAVTIDPAFGPAWAGRATVYQRQGLADSALADLAHARKAGFADPQLDLIEGIVYVQRDDGHSAYPLLDRYVTATPAAPQGWFYRGVAAGLEKRHADAERDFTEAITRGLPGPDAFRLRALARMNLGNTSGACADATEAGKRGDPASAAMAGKVCRP